MMALYRPFFKAESNFINVSMLFLTCIWHQYGYVFPPPMAKKSWIERNKKKQRVVAKYAKQRAELKEKGDYIGLSMLPRNASPCRVVNRCEVTGRRHGYLRRFKMSRITFRELASKGQLPGVTKSSW